VNIRRTRDELERGELDEIVRLGRPLDAPTDLDPLIERTGDARFVLLGEASQAPPTITGGALPLAPPSLDARVGGRRRRGRPRG
jgi:hypothetical protein